LIAISIRLSIAIRRELYSAGARPSTGNIDNCDPQLYYDSCICKIKVVISDRNEIETIIFLKWLIQKFTLLDKVHILSSFLRKMLYYWLVDD
jgi:hypothetical protein